MAQFSAPREGIAIRFKGAAAALRNVAIVVALTLLAIVFHEGGHFLVYKLSGTPVHISLQSVRPVAPVSPRVDVLAKAAGPLVSVIAASTFLLVARSRPTFPIVTAAFVNATLRLFPCVMDFVRASRMAPPFSDEGDVVLAVTTSHVGRTSLLSLLLLTYGGLTLVAARHYEFATRRTKEVVGVYLISLAVEILIVVIDELLH